MSMSSAGRKVWRTRGRMLMNWASSSEYLTGIWGGSGMGIAEGKAGGVGSRGRGGRKGQWCRCGVSKLRQARRTITEIAKHPQASRGGLRGDEWGRERGRRRGRVLDAPLLMLERWLASWERS